MRSQDEQPGHLKKLCLPNIYEFVKIMFFEANNQRLNLCILYTRYYVTTYHACMQ